MTFARNEAGRGELAASVSAKLQEAVDSVYDARANEPLDRVRPALRKALKEVGVTIHEETLDAIAAHIAAGRRVDTTPPT